MAFRGSNRPSVIPESKASVLSQPTPSIGGHELDLRLLWMAQYISTCFPDVPEGNKGVTTYIIEGGGVEFVFNPPSFVRPNLQNRLTHFSKKSPPQAKKFWGPFFKKIDVFRKI